MTLAVKHPPSLGSRGDRLFNSICCSQREKEEIARRATHLCIDLQVPTYRLLIILYLPTVLNLSTTSFFHRHTPCLSSTSKNLARRAVAWFSPSPIRLPLSLCHRISQNTNPPTRSPGPLWRLNPLGQHVPVKVVTDQNLLCSRPFHFIKIRRQKLARTTATETPNRSTPGQSSRHAHFTITHQGNGAKSNRRIAFCSRRKEPASDG